jgi:6-phosphofructokinase 1
MVSETSRSALIGAVVGATVVGAVCYWTSRRYRELVSNLRRTIAEGHNDATRFCRPVNSRLNSNTEKVELEADILLPGECVTYLKPANLIETFGSKSIVSPLKDKYGGQLMHFQV